MARKSLRLSSGSAAASATKHKRAASNTVPLSSDGQRSKRAKSTPTKSQYFKKAEDDNAVPTDDDGDGEISSPSEPDEASDFGNEVDDEESSSGGEDDDNYDSDSEVPAKQRKKVTPAKAAATSSTANTNQGKDIWRPGVKAGLGPGTQVVIKKPKARDAGKTPYQDHTIHPNTFLFLEELKANNDREWLKLHDAPFRQAEKDWHTFVQALTERLTEIDDTVPELPVKDVVFRIYRDVRFSKDQTPYKAHFSAAWSRTGRKGPYGHYYVQLSPHNESFVGGGLWHPEAPAVAAMREDISNRPRNIKDVLLDEKLRKEFLHETPKNEGKVVKAFVSRNSENALKTRPKGYDADHPDINLLRLRNYTIGRKLEEAEVVSPQGLDRIAELLLGMKPFITYLNSVVMPDHPGSQEEEDDEDEDEDESEGGDEDDEESGG